MKTLGIIEHEISEGFSFIDVQNITTTPEAYDSVDDIYVSRMLTTVLSVRRLTVLSVSFLLSLPRIRVILFQVLYTI